MFCSGGNWESRFEKQQNCAIGTLSVFKFNLLQSCEQQLLRAQLLRLLKRKLILDAKDKDNIYKKNYETTQKSTSSSFQIKLDVRAIVTSIVHHDFEPTANKQMYFCNCKLKYLRIHSVHLLLL